MPSAAFTPPALSTSSGGGGYSGSTLAAEVLRLSGLLPQPGAAKVGDACGLPLDDVGTGEGRGLLELAREDALDLVGLLNSHEVQIAKREFAVLLARLERPVVEGLTRWLFVTLRRQKRELAALEYDARKAEKAHCHGLRGTLRPRRDARSFSPGDGSEAGRDKREWSPLQSAHDGHEQMLAPGSGGSPVTTPRHQEALPHVFRRLTAPGQGGDSGHATPCHSYVSTASANLLANEDGLPPSAYIRALIEAHQFGAAHPSEDAGAHRAARVPEEKAKEIFERLYKSGKDHRIRRRVYSELGLLVEQAKEAQTCTFEPHLPTAGQFVGALPEGSVTERLYRDGLDRRRRREDMVRQAPVPSFRPRTSTSPTHHLVPGCGRRAGETHAYLMSPRDTLSAAGGEEAGHGGELRGPLGCEEAGHLEPTHLRLFREHEERRTRQVQREEMEAEWRKHTYQPDIRPSQASGPQVARQCSATGMPMDLGMDIRVGVTSEAQEDAPLPVQVALVPAPRASLPAVGTLEASAWGQQHPMPTEPTTRPTEHLSNFGDEGAADTEEAEEGHMPEDLEGVHEHAESNGHWNHNHSRAEDEQSTRSDEESAEEAAVEAHFDDEGSPAAMLQATCQALLDTRAPQHSSTHTAAARAAAVVQQALSVHRGMSEDSNKPVGTTSGTSQAGDVHGTVYEAKRGRQAFHAVPSSQSGSGFLPQAPLGTAGVLLPNNQWPSRSSHGSSVSGSSAVPMQQWSTPGSTFRVPAAGTASPFASLPTSTPPLMVRAVAPTGYRTPNMILPNGAMPGMGRVMVLSPGH